MLLINLFIIPTGDGYGNGTIIDLSRNQLTRFDAPVWKSVMEKLTKFGGQPNAYIDLYQSKFRCLNSEQFL